MGGKFYFGKYDRSSDASAVGAIPTTSLLPQHVFSAWRLASVFSLM